MKIFLIPGLGADERLFKYIRLPGHKLIYVQWHLPNQTDSLSDYAKMLVNKYDIKENDVVLGVSLGGMLTIEIAKTVKLYKAIIVSSLKSSLEAPRYFKFFKKVPVYKVIPGKAYAALGFLLKPLFGGMIKNDNSLFNSMLRNTPPQFINWAIHAVLNWKSEIVPGNVYHIIGDKDMVFSHSNIHGATIIQGGTHIMIYNRAKEINTWLDKIINETA